MKKSTEIPQWLVILLSAVVIASLAGTVRLAQAFVMDADNRRPFSEQERGSFQSVGIIAVKWSLEDRLRRIGTAILVGTPETRHDVILTAAHNFINPLTGRPHGNEFYFLTSDGAAVRITAASLGRTFSATGPVAGPDITRDWATALLEVPISQRYGALGIGVIDADGIQRANAARNAFAAIGYNPENRQLMISDRCTVIALRKGVGLVHDCDITQGWSGGPLLLLDDGLPWVIGVSTVQATNRRKRRYSFDPRDHYNVAAPISRDLRDSIVHAAETGRLRGDHILTFAPR